MLKRSGSSPELRGDRVRQQTNDAVDTELGVGLLKRVVRHVRVHHHARAALVAFEIVERGLELPTLLVGRGEFVRTRDQRIERRGEQTLGRTTAVSI